MWMDGIKYFCTKSALTLFILEQQRFDRLELEIAILFILNCTECLYKQIFEKKNFIWV